VLKYVPYREDVSMA